MQYENRIYNPIHSYDNINIKHDIFILIRWGKVGQTPQGTPTYFSNFKTCFRQKLEIEINLCLNMRVF